jgi:uncharacterized phage protein (predicted DNA packaging)
VALIDDVKAALRVDGNDHDGELSDLIAAAQADLTLSGVDPDKARDETDPLIKRAVIAYVRAHFEWDHPNTERLQTAYDMIKAHLSLSGDYRAPGGG